MNTLLVAEVHNLLLAQGRRVLDLVDSGDDRGLSEQLLEVGDAVVADTDALRLAGGEQLLHVLPGGDVVVVPEDVALAVGQLGEPVVGAVRVHAHGPVDQELVDVVQAQRLQRLVQPQLHPRAVRVPQLRHHEEVLPLRVPRVERRLQPLPDLLFVGVAVRRVDHLVAVLDRCRHGRRHLARAGLPCSCAAAKTTTWLANAPCCKVSPP